MPSSNQITTIDFILEGTITAVMPIHITSESVKSPSEAGVIYLPEMHGGQMVPCLGIKGETLKGAIRSQGVALATEMLLRGNGARMDMLPFVRNKVGGIKGAEKQRPDDVFLIEGTFLRNPIAQLFGNAEPYWVGGQVSFGKAVAAPHVRPMIIPGGARIDPMLRDPQLLASFNEEDQAAWLSLQHTTKETSVDRREVKDKEKRLRQLRRSEQTESVKAEIASLTSEIDAQKEEIQSTKRGEFLGDGINRPLPSKNAIAPGTELAQKFRGDRLLPSSFAFFLKTLEAWSDNPRIGGHQSTGYGEIKGEWHLRARVVENGFRRPWEDIGTVRLAETVFEVPDHALIKMANEKFDELLAAGTIDFGFAA